MKSEFEYFELIGQNHWYQRRRSYGKYLLYLKMYDYDYRSRKSTVHCVPPMVSVAWNSQALELGFPLGFDGTEDKSSDQAYIKSFLTNISQQIDMYQSLCNIQRVFTDP